MNKNKTWNKKEVAKVSDITMNLIVAQTKKSYSNLTAKQNAIVWGD